MKKAIVLVFCSVATAVASADKLSDFKDADRYDEGCVTIPVTYSDARNACDREGPNVLDARKKLVEDAIDTLDKCISYRRAVLNSFATALDRMRNENETDELKEVARSLANKYEKAKAGHEEQVTARTNAWNNCKAWRP